jgi:hypothetical protein
MTADRECRDVAPMMRSIERRVFEEMWIGVAGTTALLAAVAVLVGVVCFGARFSLQAAHDGLSGDWLSVVATCVFVLACASSLVGVTVRRFRYSCLALYLSALATVTGVSALWSQQTGTAGLSLWAPLGCATAAVLGLGWTRVLAIPLSRSQPDMRAAHAGVLSR